MVTRRPAAVAIPTSKSRLKALILPRIRLEMRGWVTPKRLSGLRLGQPLAFDVTHERNHERGAEFEVLCHRGIVLNGVPDILESRFPHLSSVEVGIFMS